MGPLDDIRSRLAAVDDPAALLSGFFAYSPVGLQIYRADGHSLLVNDAFRRLFGSEPPPEYNVLEDDVAARTGVLALIHRAFAGETVRVPTNWYDPRELEQVKVEQGRRVAIAATFFPLRDRDGNITHVAITFEDHTDLMLARQIAEQERERLRAVLNQLPGGVAVVRADGTLALANDAATRLIPSLSTGLPVEARVAAAQVRRADGSLCHWSELATYRAARGETVRDEEYLLEVEGRERWISVSASPLRDEAGNVVEGVATLFDITDRKRTEAEIKRLDAQKDEFLSIASHELRTPLTAMKTAVQVAARRLAPLRGDPVVESAIVAIEKAELQTQRMARLIDELLDGARFDAGGFELHPSRVDLRDVVRRVAEEARAVARTHTFEVTLPSTPVDADVDEQRIEQVLLNVVGNATRYSPPDRPIEISLAVADDAEGKREARVAIRDHGVGIDPGDLPRIFDRFYRGKHSTLRSYGGLGLGLYISAQIARRHGGELRVDSTPGLGSTFTLVLPL